MRTLFLLVALAAALVSACGCGGKLVNVEGIVRLDGKPLEGATVLFVPEGNQGRPAQALTAGDGSFRLASGSEVGAQPGNYKVLVSKTVGSLPPGAMFPSDSGPEAMPQREAYNKQSDTYLKSLLPTAYGNPATTPFKYNVPSDGPVALDLRSAGGS